jgi:hypothetical protein
MASNLALDGLSVGFLAMSADTASEFIEDGFAGLNRQVEGIGGGNVNQWMRKYVFCEIGATASFLQTRGLREA